MRKQVTLYLDYVQMRSSPKTKISQLHYGIYYPVSGSVWDAENNNKCKGVTCLQTSLLPAPWPWASSPPAS
jgi:hypothetical protein